MNWQEFIISDPAVMFGKPVVKGTRVPVDMLLEKMDNGESAEYLLAAYPNVSYEALLASLRLAADTVKNEVVYA